MTLMLRRPVAALALLALLALPARAAGILDQTPADALGVAVVRDLALTDERIQQVEHIFAEVTDAPLIGPLALVKAATGLGEGIDEHGDAAIALLAMDSAAPEPKPLIVVSVSDYAKFAASVSGDPSGEVCPVTIAGQEVLIAKRGGYAMLMNVEHRPTLEALLAAEPNPAPELAELAPWLDQTNAAVVFLPPALELLASANAGAASEREALQRELTDPAFASEMASINVGFAISDHLLAFCNSEVRAAAVGLTIDDATNVKLAKCVRLKPDGQLAALGRVAKPSDSPLAGLPDQPFVFAGGGPLPAAWAEAWVRFIVSVTKEARDLYGFAGFEDAQWKLVEESWRLWLAENAGAVAMFAGEKDDPLVSNIYNIVEVDDAAAYLDARRKSIEIWNSLTAQSTNDIRLMYEPADVEVADQRGLLLTADVAGAAGDEENPMMKVMWDRALGPGGKFRSFALAPQAKKVLVSIGDEARAARGLEWLAANERGLAESAHVTTTADLLDPAAAWTLYVSPPGYVLWAQRVLALMVEQFGAVPFTIPDYPAGPPLGISMSLADGQLRGELAAPVQTLKDFAAFIKKWEAQP
jgi:hypothetical protein